MFLKKITNLPRTLAFRLTLWYAGMFSIACVVAYCLFSFMVASALLGKTDEELLEEVEEYSILLASDGIDVLKAEILVDGEEEDVEEMFFRLLTSSGEKIIATDLSAWANAGVSKTALARLNNGDSHVFETPTFPERDGRTRIVYGAIGPGVIIQIGLSLEEDDESLKLFQGIFSITLGVLIVFVPFIGWFMARRALKGVDEVTTTALSIARGDFEQRVPPKDRGEEIERLATTFNYMLDRINALITGIRNMTDNIAHDLRSPITRIRGAAETTLLSDSTIREYKDTVAGTIEECDRLLDMVNTMLDISEAEAGATKSAREEIDVANVVHRACDLFQPIAENKRVALKADISPPCYVSGDAQMIQRMVANLLDNALKYTPPEGIVAVSVNRDNGRVVSSFSDTGIGISEVDVPHIFKRFYRCDQSRSEAGVGLGLSLAQAIAKSHGGDITVISNPGEGSTFSIILPRSPRSQ